MELLASLDALRPVEPRLTALTGYARCRPASPGGSSAPAVCSQPPRPGTPGADTLDRVRTRVRAGSAQPSPELDHAAGVWLLVHQRSRGAAGAAVERLEAAARSRPADPGVLNDLGAALYTRALAERRPGDLIRALDVFERAHEVAPNLPGPRFNRTLVLERLHLCREAAAGWRSVAGREPASPWGVEAGERAARQRCAARDLSALDRWSAGDEGLGWETVSRQVAVAPDETIRRTWKTLLPAWAADELDGDRAASERRWRRLDRLAAAVERSAGDRSLSLLADRVRDTPGDRHRLALTAREIGEAETMVATSRYGEAERHFRAAADLAAGPGDPQALWARSGIVLCQVATGRYSEARREMERARRAADLADIPSVAARLLWSEGLIQIRTGAFAEARRSFDRVAATYAAMGDAFQRAAALALAAESLQALGLGEEAWQVRTAALTELGRQPSRFLHNLLLDAAIGAHDQGLPHAALALRTVDLAESRAMGSPSHTVEALLWRSKTLSEVGDVRSALADLERALASVPAIPDAAIRGRLTADLHDARGALLADRDPAAAVAELSQALPLYEATDYAWKIPSTLFTRAQAQRRLRHDREAERDLERAIAEFESRDRRMPPEILRYSHFERAQQIFDEMIRLQVDRGRRVIALGYADRARHAAWPLEPPAEGAGGEEAGRERMHWLVERLPAGTTAVEYTVVGQRLLTWVIGGDEVRFYQGPATGLESRIEAFGGQLGSPATSGAELEATAGGLYRELLGPWIDTVPPGDRLVFVPDRFLHRLSFAALRDPPRGRWLAEAHVVSTSPSLAFAVGGDRSTPRPPAVELGTALLIGDPRFDPAETGYLPSLPGAEEEVNRLAALYPGARLLVGERATRDAVLAALRDADLVHYAGHVLPSPRRPWASSLPLAPPTGGGSGLLLAGEVHALPVRRRRAVVLSACGSTPTAESRSTGFSALVSAFLATGAESVIASQWSVGDRSVLPLAVELHRGLLAGLPAAEALQTAQRRLLERSPGLSPHVWASLQVTGTAGGGATDAASAPE